MVSPRTVFTYPFHYAKLQTLHMKHTCCNVDGTCSRPILEICLKLFLSTVFVTFVK